MAALMLPVGPPEAVERVRVREHRPWLQALALLLVFVVAEVFGGVCMTWGGASATGAGLRVAPLAVLAVLAVPAVVVLGGRAAIRFTARREPAELGYRGAVPELLRGLVLGGLLMGLVVAVLALVGAYRVVAVGWSAGVLTGLYLGVLGGFAEELLFRGLLVRLLENLLGSGWALVLSSLGFGLLHLGNPEATLFGALAISLEAGLLLGAGYMLTRRLWLVIGVHAGWNFTQGGVFGSDVSGTGNGRGLFEAAFTGPDWLTGGQMGIEGSVVTVVLCTLAGAWLLWAAWRRGLWLTWAQARRRPAQGALADSATD